MDTAPRAPVSDFKGWATFVLLAFVWGGSFILIKKGLIHFTAIEVGAIRRALSAIAFVPIFLISKVKFQKPKSCWSPWLYSPAMGYLPLCLPLPKRGWEAR
ncbi:MAG: EamA family transporter [Saprospiraceae bacterium]|nr:EamA family transporter [Candidatus Opimibacter iunctus]